MLKSLPRGPAARLSVRGRNGARLLRAAKAVVARTGFSGAGTVETACKTKAARVKPTHDTDSIPYHS
jgi:hypothetical protein